MVYNPKISIVTSSYNQAKYIEKTIHSVLNQSYTNFEYIIIDGGSTDGTIQIVNKYINKLKLFITEKDDGCADALNKGLKFCSGDIFFYLNSDDYLLENSLHTVVKFISNNPGFNIYYGHALCLDEIKNKTFKIYSSKWNLLSYTNKNCVLVQQSTFFLIEDFQKVIKFNTQNRTCWDSELLIDLSLKNYSFCRMPFSYILSVFRLHSISITGSQNTYKIYIKDQKRIKEKVKIYKFYHFINIFHYFRIFEVIRDPKLFYLRLKSNFFNL